MFSDHGRPDSCRRQFLLAFAGIASTSLCTSASFAAAGFAGDDDAVALRAVDKGLYRVQIEMEVEGNANVPKNPLVSRKVN